MGGAIPDLTDRQSAMLAFFDLTKSVVAEITKNTLNLHD